VRVEPKTIDIAAVTLNLRLQNSGVASPKFWGGQNV